jgi:hypothetical protein
MWAYHKLKMLNYFGIFYVEKILIQNGCTLEAMTPYPWVVHPVPLQVDDSGTEQRFIISTIEKSALGLKGIFDSLFHQSQPWTVEDLVTSDIWYISILAHTDIVFN